MGISSISGLTGLLRSDSIVGAGVDKDKCRVLLRLFDMIANRASERAERKRKKQC